MRGGTTQGRPCLRSMHYLLDQSVSGFVRNAQQKYFEIAPRAANVNFRERTDDCSDDGASVQSNLGSPPAIRIGTY